MEPGKNTIGFFRKPEKKTASANHTSSMPQIVVASDLLFGYINQPKLRLNCLEALSIFLECQGT